MLTTHIFFSDLAGGDELFTRRRKNETNPDVEKLNCVKVHTLIQILLLSIGTIFGMFAYALVVSHSQR